MADSSLGKELIRSTALFHDGLFFNNLAEPFDQIKVRQAFSTAIDRGGWIDKVKNGVGMPATSWLPPEMPGFDPELGTEYAFNPGRARELLKEAGFPEGEGFPTVSLAYIEVGDQGIMAQFIQGQIKETLGVEMSLEAYDPPSFFQQVAGAGEFQLASIGWGADYPDPENFLAPLFVTGAGNNLARYSN